MKAIYFEEHGSFNQILKLGELPKPKIEKHEVLIKVKAFSLNHLDIWIMEGKYPFPIPMPHIIASDASGIVEEIGECVDNVKVGEEVIIFSGISCGKCEACISGKDNLCPEYFPLGTKNQGVAGEYVKVPARNIFKKPKNLSFEEASAICITYTTMWHSLITKAQIKAGDTVLIHGGASGVGTAGIQIAKLFGANVITTVGDEWKVEKVENIGANFVINYNKEDFVEKIKKITDGNLCDVVVDHIGKATFIKSIEVAKKGGKVITFGTTTGADTEINLRSIFGKNLDIHGVFMGTRGEFIHFLKFFPEKLKPVIDEVFEFKDIKKAYEKMLSRQFVGKLVVKVD